MIVMLAIVCVFNVNINMVRADPLSDSIDTQIEKINLDDFEDYFNSVAGNTGLDFFECFNALIKGEYNLSYQTIYEYIIKIFFSEASSFMPTFIGVVAVSIFCGVMKNVRGTFLSENFGDIIVFVGVLSIIILLTNEIVAIFSNVQITIKNMANLTEIMSPIIITLMIASGGNVSASVYKPAVAFLSGGIVSVSQNIIFPLLELILIFTIISGFSSLVKLNKFSECAYSSIKWIVGIVVTIFSVFLTIQGITSAAFDGISIKAAKFAISNSVPLIGVFLSGGFDVVIAGSVIIKNVVGITTVIALFYTVLTPIITITIFVNLLKIVAAIIEPISDEKITSFLGAVTKCVSYLTVVLLMVGLMIFITVLLLIFSANSFV